MITDTGSNTPHSSVYHAPWMALWRLAVAIVLTGTLLMGSIPTIAQPREHGSAPRFAIHTINADDQALRMAHNAGASAIVQLFPWSSLEPAPGEFFWEYPDFVLRACEYYGMDLIIRLDHPPAWAMEEDDTGKHISSEAFARLVREVVGRYRGRVGAYIIWNEPNLAREWAGMPPDPTGYTRLLQDAYEAVKATDPDALVVAAGMAPTNQQDETALDDRLYLQGMLAAGAGEFFDILSVHPYAFGQPPDAPGEINNGLNMARLDAIIDILAAHGLQDRPLWATELGWTVDPPPEDAWMQVTEQLQADHLTRVFELAPQRWPTLTLITVWNLSVELPEEDEKRGYSIIYDDYRPRPAYHALARDFGRRSPRQILLSWFEKWQRRYHPVVVLAPDIVIRLGDRDTFHPHWARIYGNVIPSRHWFGTFYVPNPGHGQWKVTMETMQVEEHGNRVFINGHRLVPPSIPLRGKPEFTSVWTRTHLIVPANVLEPGANTIEVFLSPRRPPYQGVRYESLQFRNIQLEPIRP